jgi:hypothetical protein
VMKISYDLDSRFLFMQELRVIQSEVCVDLPIASSRACVSPLSSVFAIPLKKSMFLSEGR